MFPLSYPNFDLTATGVHPVRGSGVRVDPPRRHPVHSGSHDERGRVEGEGPRQLRADRGEPRGKRRSGMIQQ